MNTLNYIYGFTPEEKKQKYESTKIILLDTCDNDIVKLIDIYKYGHLKYYGFDNEMLLTIIKEYSKEVWLNLNQKERDKITEFLLCKNID